MFNVRQTAIFGAVCTILKDGFVDPSTNLDPSDTLQGLGLTSEDIQDFTDKVKDELWGIIICYENSHYKLEDIVLFIDNAIVGYLP